MSSTCEPQQRITLQVLTLELRSFHSTVGFTFRHRRQPLTVWFVLLLVFIVLDTIIEIAFTFVLDYNQQLFFAVGHISAYFFGDSYRYIPIVSFYKVIGLFTLIIHVTADYDWIRLVDTRLLALGDRVVVTRADMTAVLRNGRLLTQGSIRFWIVVALLGYLIQTFFVHSGRVPCHLALPTFFTLHLITILYTYVNWCLLGQYYFLLSYFAHLVRVVTDNLMEVINDDDHNQTHIEQALADFEVIGACVRQVWQYTSKIYVLHMIVISYMIPVYIFSVVFTNIAIFIKLMIICAALYFLSVVSLMSYLPGRIDMQLEPVADRFYRSILTKDKIWCLSKLRYKYFKFEMHALHGFGLSIAGYRINLSTCLTLATVYVSVFSFLIHFRSSVGQIKFVR